MALSIVLVDGVPSLVRAVVNDNLLNGQVGDDDSNRPTRSRSDGRQIISIDDFGGKTFVVLVLLLNKNQNDIVGMATICCSCTWNPSPPLSHHVV